jgi:hypothetical protein
LLLLLDEGVVHKCSRRLLRGWTSRKWGFKGLFYQRISFEVLWLWTEIGFGGSIDSGLPSETRFLVVLDDDDVGVFQACPYQGRLL